MKKVLALVLALVMMLSLVACGAGGSKGGDVAVGEVANGNAKVTITVGDLIEEEVGENIWYVARQKAFEEKYPNITVNHIAAPKVDATRLVQSISTLFVSKDAPTMMSVSAVQYARDLYNMNVTADVSAYTGLIGHYDEIYDSITSSLTTTDKALIGFGYSMDIPLFGVRRSAVEDAGLTMDDVKVGTWDEYAETVAKLTTADRKGASFWAAEANLWVDNWAKSNGALIATQNEDGTISLDFTNEKFIQMVEYWRGLYADGYVNETINYADLNDMFAEMFNDNVATFTMYPSWASWFSSSGIAAQDVAMYAFPKGPSGEYLANIYPAAYVFNGKASAAEIEAAVLYVDFIYGYEGWTERLTYRHENDIFSTSIPQFETIDWTQYNDELPADWAEAATNALANGYVTDLASTAWSNYIVAVLPELITGDADIKATLADAQALCESEWLTSFNEDALAEK